MALGVITNPQSLNAQRNLLGSQSAQQIAMQRLSSGLRINSAKDDAAGLGISDRMTSQIRGLNQAARNANDGISMAQTAEGALQETTNLLQRMRELAVQAVNDTNTESDRVSIQAEVDALYKELDRIANTTKFNGKVLLDGTATNSVFQIGADAGETLSLSVESATTQALNLNGYTALGELNGGRINVTAPVVADTIQINGVAITAAATDITATLKAAKLNTYTQQTGVTATAYNVVRGGSHITGITSGFTLTVGGTAYTISASGSAQGLVDNINRDAAGVTAVLNSDDSITLSNNTGATIQVGGTVAGSGFSADTFYGYISLTSGDNSAIALTDSTTGVELAKYGFNAGAGSSSKTSTAVTATAVAATDLITINGVRIGASTDSSAASKAKVINDIKAQTGVTATALTTASYTLDFTAAVVAAATAVTINGTVIDLSGTTSLAGVVTAINTTTPVPGVKATADASTGQLVLTADTGIDIVVVDTSNFVTAAGTTRGKLTLTSDSGGTITVGSDLATEAAKVTAAAKLGFVQDGGSSEAIGSGLSVSTAASATIAIERIDEALMMVDENRGALGAFQNRLDSTISNLNNVSENLSVARSRIKDADFAAETASMTKSNILIQSGVAMLVQANQASQYVLSLLRG